MTEISFIMPIYTFHPTLIECTKKCVKSLFQKTPLNFELIVVDGTPTHPLEKWFNTINHNWNLDTPIKYVKLNQNYWYSYMSNRGYEQSDVKTKYVMVLDNDFVFTDEWLQPLLETLEIYPKIGAVGPVLCDINGYVENIGGNILVGWKDSPIFIHTIKKGMIMPVSYLNVLLVKRKLLKYYLLEETLINKAENILLSMHVWSQGSKVCLVGNSKIFHAKSQTLKSDSRLRDSWRIAEKHGIQEMTQEEFQNKIPEKLICNVLERCFPIQSRLKFLMIGGKE